MQTRMICFLLHPNAHVAAAQAIKAEYFITEKNRKSLIKTAREACARPGPNIFGEAQNEHAVGVAFDDGASRTAEIYKQASKATSSQATPYAEAAALGK